jgi:electron transport complex protein RnfG
MREQIWYMALILGGVGTVAGLGLSAIKSLTDPVIEQRILEEKIQPSLDRFFGPLEPDNDYLADRVTLDLGRDARGRRREVTVFTARRGNALIGAALQTTEGGYGGDIEVLTVFDIDDQVILGAKTLDQKETQGLGARVANDDDPFLRQFQGMDYSRGVKLRSDGGRVDAISGATITSTAYTKAIEEAASLLERHQERIARGRDERSGS